MMSGQMTFYYKRWVRRQTEPCSIHAINTLPELRVRCCRITRFALIRSPLKRLRGQALRLFYHEQPQALSRAAAGAITSNRRRCYNRWGFGRCYSGKLKSDHAPAVAPDFKLGLDFTQFLPEFCGFPVLGKVSFFEFQPLLPVFMPLVDRIQQ